MMAEEDRQCALQSYEILDTPPDKRFDRITQLSAGLFGTSMALVSLIDRHRQWHKSHHGLDLAEIPRKLSFCEHTIKGGRHSVMVIPDATLDPRFVSNPLVVGQPGIRFYAGASLTTQSGHNIGALCILDNKPRDPLTPAELAMLQTLASFVIDELDYAHKARVIEEHEQLFKLTKSMAGIGHWRYDARSREMTWAEAVYAIHGVDPATFVPTPQSVSALYRPSVTVSFQDLIDRAMKTGEAFSTHFTLDRNDGAIRSLEYKTTCMFGNGHEVSAVIGVLQDVTEQIAATRLAKDNQTRFRMLAENTNTMVSHVGRDGTRLYVSPASETLFGLLPSELARSAVWPCIHPDERDGILQWREHLLTEPFDRETRMFRATDSSKETIWIEAVVQSVRCPITGEPDGYISVCRNVSDRRAAISALRASEERLRVVNADLEQLTRHLTKARDQAERSSEAKSRFLASISHELRTPLHGILGYAQMLRRESTLTSNQSTWIDAMLDAGTHLHAMINSVLNLSAIESGAAEMSMADIAVSDLVTSCLDLVRPKAESKGIALIRDTPADLPRSLKSDATRLRQILVNLLGNALKFTPSGRVTLGVTSVNRGASLRFSVTDTGPGIPLEHRSRIFREFERLDTASATHEEGMGLGLAISTRLALQLGSRLIYEDGPYGGSVFALELPIEGMGLPFETDGKSCATNGARVPSSLQGLDSVQLRRLKVLVVDDVEINRDIACSFLHSAGHTAVVAQGGFEAVAMVAETDFDVVLMDVRMPGVDGLEASRRIRKLNGPRRHVPIIAVTAQAYADQVEECHKAGMGSHLSKPFTSADLLDIVAAEAKSGAQYLMQIEIAAAPSNPQLAPPEVPRPPALPILNKQVYDQTAAILSPEAIQRHTLTLADRFDALLLRLVQPDAVTRASAELADAAHTISGSAGMFGFERLSSDAKLFERAANTNSPDITERANTLVATLRESVTVIRAERGSDQISENRHSNASV
jgi:PAS domain S-box-containing protein